MKLDVVSSSIFTLETEPVASSKTFVSFYQTSYPERLNSWSTESLCNRCSAACTVFTFNGWMVQWCSIKCTSFSSKREIAHSGNLKWILLSCNRNLAPKSHTLKLKSIRQYWSTENGWQHFWLVGHFSCKQFTVPAIYKSQIYFC